MPARTLEIDSLERFDVVTSGTHARHSSLAGAVVQSLDLTDRTDALANVAVHGAVFLGCTFAPGDQRRLRGRGALLFPAIPELPFDPYRGDLYTAAELYDASPYADTLDATVYAWSRSPRSAEVAGSLGRSLHDHAIDDALDDLTSGVRAADLVGVMGGHALERGSVGYADAARLGRALARSGAIVLTGGGPGAMEAANLGARLADESDAALDVALDVLATAPNFADDIDAWVATAREVIDRFPSAHTTVGIPTWFYGHEPPNLFATHIAKYFANPLREATLLERCTGGIVYLPGAAGTVQEIFADACENYYASNDVIAPMVLWGSAAWTEKLPAWQLLRELATGRPMAERIHLADDIDATLAALGRTPVRP